MDALLLAAIVVLLTAVVVFVARPFYVADKTPERDQRLAELELEKQAKYAEIRDAEAEYRAGKLSEADYKQLDGELRAEAIDLLREIDELDADPARTGDPAPSR